MFITTLPSSFIQYIVCFAYMYTYIYVRIWLDINSIWMKYLNDETLLFMYVTDIYCALLFAVISDIDRWLLDGWLGAHFCCHRMWHIDHKRTRREDIRNSLQSIINNIYKSHLSPSNYETDWWLFTLAIAIRSYKAATILNT